MKTINSNCYKTMPFELIGIIMEYTGTMRYYKNQFISIIKKDDYRYAMLDRIINRRRMVINETHVNNKEFYFECYFDTLWGVGLCYDHNWSKHNKFEICYFDFRNEWKQIRTVIE
jgi:hypothetical protein